MRPAATEARGETRAATRWRVWRAPLDDLVAVMDAQIVRAARPGRATVRVVAAGILTWWVYVPVHELLHALGCYVTGGAVTELQIGAEYGGALFARVLPFVTTGGEYAGRLSGFDTHGSDLVYLFTDLLPFFLTIGIGVPLLKASAQGERPALFGAAFVLALAPFYCVGGDYYEMGSILTTRAVTLWQGGGDAPAYARLRSDDVARLVSQWWSDPAQLQLHSAHAVRMGMIVITTSLLVGVVLAFATYAAGAWWARRLHVGCAPTV